MSILCITHASIYIICDMSDFEHAGKFLKVGKLKMVIVINIDGWHVAPQVFSCSHPVVYLVELNI